MEQFNKALSFILGLVVVAVFIVVASGKFSFKGISFPKSNIAGTITPTPKPTSKPWFSFNKPTVKPTTIPTVMPTVKPTVTPKTNIYSNPNYNSYTGSNAPTSIPNTGVPIVLFPLFGTSLLTGIFMRKTGKKE